MWIDRKTGEEATITELKINQVTRIVEGVKLNHRTSQDSDRFIRLKGFAARYRPSIDCDVPWRIVSAAILMDDGMIIPGVRHYSPDMRAVMLRVYGVGYHRHQVTQGFIDARGRFFDRLEAWTIADQYGQIHTYGQTLGVRHLIRRAPNVGDVKELCSENLY